MKLKPVTSRRGPKATPTAVKFLAYDGLVSLPRELIERALGREDAPIDYDVEKIKVQVFTDAKKRFVYVTPFFEDGAKPASIEASIFRVWKPKRNAHTVYFSSLALFAALQIKAEKLPARYEAKVLNGMIRIDTSRGKKILPRKARG
jgi:hypothetical protein